MLTTTKRSNKLLQIRMRGLRKGDVALEGKR
jgi:hypothetical protein